MAYAITATCNMFNNYVEEPKYDFKGNEIRLGKEGVHLVPSFGGNTASVSLYKHFMS